MRRIAVIVAFGAVMAVATVSPAQAQSTAACSTTPVVAHRGATGDGEENTIEGWDKNRRNNGVHWIETDLTLTKDGRLVIFHDKNMKRTTGVDKFIKDVNYDNLPRTLDGYKIPTFGAALEWAVSVNTRMLVEVKVPLNWPQVNELVQLKGMDPSRITYDYQPGNLPDGYSLRDDAQLVGHTGIKSYGAVDPPPGAAKYGDSLRVNYTYAEQNQPELRAAGETQLFQKTTDVLGRKDTPELWASAVSSGAVDEIITNAAGAYQRWCATQQ